MNESTDTLVRLTIAFPPAIEARIVELLLEQEPPLPGFTILRGEGHGADRDRQPPTLGSRLRPLASARRAMLI